MAKGKNAKNQSAVKTGNETSDSIGIVSTIIISLYLLIDCVPKIEIQDQMGLHWLLIAVLNVLSAAYIFKSKNVIEGVQLKSIFKNGITIPYLLFFVIAGLSLLVAINPIEGFIIYNRLFTIVTAFFIIGILLYRRIYLLKNLAVLITFIVLAQAFNAVMQFYSGVGKVDLSVLINNIQSTAGNKNIFAAALVIKIPFIIYCLFTREGLLKYLSVLSLCLALMSIFIINARSAYLGIILELVILLVGTAFIYTRDKQRKLFLSNASFVIVALIIAFLISQNSLNKAVKNAGIGSTYGTVTSRLGALADNNVDQSSSGRIGYWKKTVDFIGQRPFIGVGYGNWKLYTPKYTNTLLDDNVFSKHPHNDFLEIAGETGIPNSIIYFLVFVIAFIFTVKRILSKQNLESKVIAVIAFASLSGYFIDAFFNFPQERPNIQVLFVLIIAIILINYITGKSSEDITTENVDQSSLVKVFSITLLVLGIGTIYMHATILKSMKAQYIVDNDLNSVDNLPNAMPKYKFSEVNGMFPSFPNIAENSETIGYKKAKYLQKEKRFDQAIKLLDSVHKYSPNIVYDDYLKCNIYQEQNKLDSAYVYGKKAFYAKPRNFYYYRMASYLARVNKEPKEIIKMFNLYNSYRKDQQSWSYYTLSLFYSDYDRKEVKKIVDAGLKIYPTDSVMRSFIPYLPK